MWADTAKPGDEYGADVYAMEWHPPAVVDAASIAEADLYARAIRQTCAPLREDDLIFELGKLRMKVARRAEDDADQQLLFEAYIEELADQPADIVLDVLRLWPRMSRFWPAIDDLRPMIDRRVRQRRGLLRALDDLSARAGAAAA